MDQNKSAIPHLSPVIVAGMHRSGTSLLARILAEAGVHIGQELDIHNESLLFKRINKKLLSRAGASWVHPELFLAKLNEKSFIEKQAQFAIRAFEDDISEYGCVGPERRWGWKDPRNTLTLPIWLNAFPDARVIYVQRHGIDVALSLQRREFRRIPCLLLGRTSEKAMFPPTLLTGYNLWRTYVRQGEMLQKNYGDNWLSIRYEDVILDPLVQISALQEFLDLQVFSSEIERIASRIVKHPTSRTHLETLRVRLLIHLNLLDPHPLYESGYGLLR